jgi:sensor histidine kinase regulating citrate/malate metabolism
MKDYETVSNYITENIYTTNLTSDYYSSRIKDDKITALFVGKDIQSKEYDTSIRLSDDSNLSKSHKPISSDDLIIVIGNLIDNSLEAFQKNKVENRKISVKIFEDDDMVKIGVSDNAGGIDQDIKNRMWKRGVSSKKGDSRGTGLSLVNEIVKMYNGEKQVQSSKYNTYIEITLKKVK